MKISEPIYDRCGECGHNKRMTQDARYGCDACGAEIDRDAIVGKHRHYLEVTVFSEGDDGTTNTSRMYCSWTCVLRDLRTLTTNYFITLPYLTYDGEAPVGQRAEDFFRAIAAGTEGASPDAIKNESTEAVRRVGRAEEERT